MVPLPIASVCVAYALRFFELHHALGSPLFGPQLIDAGTGLPRPGPFVRGQFRIGGLALIRLCLGPPGHNALYPDPNSRKTWREARHKFSGQY